MALSQSKAEQTVEFSVEPAAAATICQEVIRDIGLIVKTVSRETGLIAARASSLSFNANRELVIKISKSEKGTAIAVTATAAEGLGASGRAQKLLAQFLQKLGSHASLAQKSLAGW